MSAYLLRRRKLGKTSCNSIEKFSTTGIFSVLHDRDEIPDNIDLCIRWGCTANVPQKQVLNKASAIHLVTDKTTFRTILNKDNLCPKTFTHWADSVYPCVVRPQFHHQGRNLFFCENYEQLSEAYIKCGPGWYGSEFIDKVAEYRVFCLQGRVLCVARKTPANPEAIAWNVAQGGRFDNVRWDDWPLKAIKISLRAMELSGLDFGGVDIMVDKEGECYVLEINSAPSLTSEYRQRCFAKGFDWVVNNGKDRIKLVDKLGGYKKFIHPAVCDAALI